MRIQLLMLSLLIQGSLHLIGQGMADINNLQEKLNVNYSLINGAAILTQYPSAKGHPFFENNGWVKGSIVIGDDKYADVLIIYDLLNDELIYQHINNNVVYSLKLTQYFITSFMINQKVFINIKEGALLDPGYYQHIYEGNNVKQYKKHSKYIKEATETSAPQYEMQTDNYLIIRDEVHKWNSRFSLLKALKDHKKEVKKYLRQNQIHINQISNLQLTNLLKFYEDLLVSKESEKL